LTPCEPQAGHWTIARIVVGLDVETRRRSLLAHDNPRPEPWAGNDSAQLSRKVMAIIGFRIEIAGLEGKKKLRQNHHRRSRTE
jgi:predicted FMN-binding regulatory protein PaiB